MLPTEPAKILFRQYRPQADSCGAARRALFDHLVGAAAQGQRHFEPERLGSPEVDHQLVLGWRLHRQVGRLLALEDAVDVAGGKTVSACRIDAEGYQSAFDDKSAKRIDGGQSKSRDGLDDCLALRL